MEEERKDTEDLLDEVAKYLQNIPGLELDISEELDDIKTRQNSLQSKWQKKAIQKMHKLPFGEIGLKQILDSESIQNLDKYLEMSLSKGLPQGEALLKRTTQLAPAQRTREYKRNTFEGYQAAVKIVKEVYAKISIGRTVSFKYIRRIIESFFATLVTDKAFLLNLSNLIPKANEDYLYHHVLNRCVVALNIATASGYSKEQVMEIGCSAFLADVGMLLISEDIRFKPERLNGDERYEVQKHPVVGYHVLSKNDSIPESINIGVYQHHERMNRSGYPKKRGGKIIHNYSKIIAIADVYVALIAPRAYRNAIKPYRAMEMIIYMASQGQLDLEHTKNFLAYMCLFPIGSLVKLKSGKIAKVIQSNLYCIDKPLVSVLQDENGKKLKDEEIYQVDLWREDNDKIIEALGLPSNQNQLMAGF